jgi:hypothetical protein
MKIWLSVALGALLHVTALAPLAAAPFDDPAPPAPAPTPVPGPGPRPVPGEAPIPTPPPEAFAAGEVARAAQSQLFSVALVLADNSNGGTKLPPALEKAIADVRDFLPYRSFRLVDSGLTRTSREGTLVLRGDNGDEYRAQMLLYPSDRGPDNHSFFFEGFRLDVRAPQGSKNANGAPRPPVQNALNASFRIDRGETVVVGSARLESVEGAIIVLLTAVP